MNKSIGVIGLGVMGGEYAKHLLLKGFRVNGHDQNPEMKSKINRHGGVFHKKLGNWLKDCDAVLLSLPNSEAMFSTVKKIVELKIKNMPVVETGTFNIGEKLKARDILKRNNLILLDCPVSGTGAQAASGDLVILGSGNQETIRKCKPWLETFSRKVINVGDFGNGMKFKMVANLAVILHNIVAAESLVFAEQLKLDPNKVYDVLSEGAGASKMLQLRMPLMISGSYKPPTANLDIYAKDIDIISQGIKSSKSFSPLFDVAVEIYNETFKNLDKNNDAASVIEILRNKVKND